MRVAVLEDDVTLQKTLAEIFAKARIEARIYGTGEEFSVAIRQESFDAIILDWTVPDTTGIEVLRSLRDGDNRVPVLFATARDAEEDVVEALGAGADDYMVKPLRGDELIARLHGMVRRSSPPTSDDRFLNYDRFKFDLRTQTLTSSDTQIDMTQKEFHLALLLFSSIGQPLSRGHIRKEVWGHDSDVPSRTMDTHISRVRTKLSLRPEDDYLLAPVYSFGYRLEHLKADTPEE